MQKQKKKKQVQNFKEKGSANSTTTTKIFIEQGNIKKLNTRYDWFRFMVHQCRKVI